MARNFASASLQYIALSTTPQLSGLSAGSVLVWVKFTESSNIICAYCEADSGDTNPNLYIQFNNGATAGRVKAYRKGATGNAISITYDGGYDDGAWHCVVFAWSALNAHYLYVDGSQVGSDTSTTVTAYGSQDRLQVGRNVAGATADRYFNGDIADLALYGTALNGTNATDLYNKDKHAMSVTSLANIRAYWPFAGSDAMPNKLLDEIIADYSTTNNGSTESDGPDTDNPTGMTLSTDILNAYIWVNQTNTALVVEGGGEAISENGNMVHTPDDVGKEYKYYYTTSPDPRTASNGEIAMAYSSNLSSWADYGTVIDNSVLPTEDPFVTVDPSGGLYHLWCENKTGGTNDDGIAHFTSSDGIDWTLEAATALDNGSAGQWDEDDVSSPIIWVEGGTWYMLYEGRGDGSSGRIGLATASSPNGPWTKSGSNPVATHGLASGYDSTFLVPNDLEKIGSTYYMVYRGYNGSNFYNLLAYSSNLTSWTGFSRNPLGVDNGGIMFFAGTDYDGGIMNSGTQVERLQFIGDAATQTAEWPAAISARIPRHGASIMNGTAII